MSMICQPYNIIINGFIDIRKFDCKVPKKIQDLLIDIKIIGISFPFDINQRNQVIRIEFNPNKLIVKVMEKH